ncbi:MAG: hypothetical protein KAJ51_10960, partial [Thermoplasmata archaeon]|nr:hypothetical protein [Thermoplasmata archaeon]
ISAKAKVSFYLDSTSKTPIGSVDVTVPQKGTVSASTNWVAREGKWSVIVLISDTNPQDPDTSNNQVSKELIIGAGGGDSDGTSSGGIFDSVLNMPTNYKYALIAGIFVLITLIAIGLAVRTAKNKKRREPKKQDTDRIDKVTGAVVFMPVEDKDKSRTSKVSVGVNLKAPVVVLIFAILAVIMMGVSITQPWYSNPIEMGSGESAEKIERDYSLTGIELSSSESDATLEYSWDDDELEELGFDETIGLYKTTQTLVTISFIFCILLLIFATFALKGKGKKLIIFFGLLAFISCLIGPVLFMQQHPGALNSDLEIESDKGAHDSFMGAMGTEVLGEQEVETWGPGIGWYLAIFGFMFALCGFIAAFKIPKSKPAAEPEPMREKPREIVFKPITDEDTSVKAKPEKAIVKFETIGMQ